MGSTSFPSLPPPDVLLFEYISPALGVVMACATFTAPLASLKEAIRTRSLGDLNPLPWAVMTGNCAGWIAYSYLVQDYFVLFANAPGFMLSIWLNMSAVKLQFCETSRYDALGEDDAGAHDADAGIDMQLYTEDGPDADDVGQSIRRRRTADKSRAPLEISSVPSTSHLTTPHERALLLVAAAWVVILSYVAFAPAVKRNVGLDATVVGLAVNANLMFFYGAPLSAIAKVARERDSSAIHGRTMAMNTVNGVFWSVYGIARKDAYIYVPNLMGVGFGIVQIVLKWVFPARPTTSIKSSTETLS